jgi:hypothetical protein
MEELLPITSRVADDRKDMDISKAVYITRLPGPGQKFHFSEHPCKIRFNIQVTRLQRLLKLHVDLKFRWDHSRLNSMGCALMYPRERRIYARSIDLSRL